MKTIVKIVASLSLALLALACQQFVVDTQMTPEKAASMLRLESDALDSYTIQGEKPQAVSFKVSSTTPWTITRSENAEWLKVSPASSSVSGLSADVVITASANDDYSDRSVVLTLSGDNTDKTYTITITQLRKGKLFVQPVTDVFEAAGSTLPFTIESNIAWEVRSSEQWLTFSENSGAGDGSIKTIQATAAANSSISRSATVTVSAGDETKTFEVNQKGQSLEFLPVENPSIAGTGGELELGVKATMDWKVECDNKDITVEKAGNDKVKVIAASNNKFADRKAVITIKPVSDDFGDVSSQVELSQECIFSLEGNCEVLEDGSVKISSGAKSRVTTKELYRYASFVLTMGDVSFDEKGTLCLSTHDAGNGTAEYQCQINLDGNKRLRTNGSGTKYDTAKFSISKDELNAMKTYRMDFAPAEGGNIRLEFFYNGTSMASLTNSPSVYTSDPATGGHYFFGFESSKDDKTWYIIKSCDITILGE